MKGTYFQSSARIKIYGNVNIKPTIQQQGIKAEPSFSDYSHDKPNKKYNKFNLNDDTYSNALSTLKNSLDIEIIQWFFIHNCEQEMHKIQKMENVFSLTELKWGSRRPVWPGSRPAEGRPWTTQLERREHLSTPLPTTTWHTVTRKYTEVRRVSTRDVWRYNKWAESVLITNS